MRENFSITNKTKSKIPRVSFLKMKEAVLGKNYELSLVFVGEKKMQALNRTYRKKDKPTDILSFSLSKTSGEIFINPEQTRIQSRNFSADVPTRSRRRGREADSIVGSKKFSRLFSNFVGFLFIHGLLHLKGLAHGSTMEKEEKKIRAKFGI